MALAASVVALVAIVVRVGLNGSGAAPTCTVASAAGNTKYSLTPQQAQNAAIIAAVALQKGLPDHAVTVAVAASLQETKLQNLPYGDLDSVGLFQQRPSQGWGAKADLLDPAYAASAFYNRLAQISGWQSMAVTDAAQAVQRSAAPSAYAAWEGEGRQLARALTGEIPAGMTCRFDRFGGSAPSVAALASASRTEMGSALLGTPVSDKVGWQVAVWAVAHAYAYHVRSVAFAGWNWSSSAGVWKHTSTSNGSSTSTEVVATY